MKPRALFAELLGTFALTFGVFISLNAQSFPVATPVIAALTVALFVYMIGPVSGCHINPAVTAGVFAIGRINIQEAIAYIVAQFAGGALAMAAAGVFVPGPIELETVGGGLTGFAELLGAALLAFAVATVVIGRVPGNLSGVVIGTALLLGISWAAIESNGVLNPAVALGIGSFSLPYIWGPLVGGVAGATLANYLCAPDVD